MKNHPKIKSAGQKSVWSNSVVTIVVDSLAVMVLYSVQVRATSFSSFLERPYCLQNSDQPSGILAVESMNGVQHSES